MRRNSASASIVYSAITRQSRRRTCFYWLANL